MASGATYQYICPEVTVKPWSVMSPDVEGRGRHDSIFIGQPNFEI